MTRVEFSQMLIEARTQSNITRSDVTKVSGLSYNNIFRIEKCDRNFRMAMALQYIKGISHSLQCQHKNTATTILTYKGLIKYLTPMLQNRSAEALARKVGCTGSSIRNILHNSSTTGVDIIIQLLDVLDITIQIKPKHIENSLIKSESTQKKTTLTRVEFSQMLVEAKINSGITTTTLSFTMKLLHGNLRRIERATNNYNINKALNYLHEVSHHMTWLFMKRTFVILTYESLIEKIVLFRKKQYISQRELAELVNCSHVTIANIETHKSVVSIDLLLKILDTLSVTIQIKPITNKQ